jgi:hypothetical protein
MSEDVRETQAMAQEPALSEDAIARGRAIHECRQQLTSGSYNIHNILHILQKAA